MGRRYTKAERQKAELLVAGLRALSARLKAVGDTPEARLIWLTEFVRRNVSDPTTYASTAGELNVFLLHHHRAWAGDFGSAVDLQQFIEPHDVPRIQSEVVAVLDGISPDGRVWFASSIADGLLWRPDRGLFLVTRAPGVPQVLAAVANLLMTIGSRLHRCETPSCRRLFARNRPAQKRCTTKCGGTDRVREWRRKNPKRVSENQHRRYVRTIAKQLPGARVARRPRKAD